MARHLDRRAQDPDSDDRRMHTVDGISVQRIARETAAGREEYVKFSQAKPQPDGSVRRQKFVIALRALRGIAASLFPALAQDAREGPTRRAERPVEHWAVVAFEREVQKGAIVRVERCFERSGDADLYARDKPCLVYPNSFKEELKPGEHLLLDAAESEKLARKLREVVWRKEHQCEHFGYGVWFDRDSLPDKGQRVRIETAIDYRGQEFTERVMPRGGAYEPGEGLVPRYVVFKKHATAPGRGDVAFVTHDKGKAIRVMEALEKRAQDLRQAKAEIKWKGATFSQAPSSGAVEHGLTPIKSFTSEKGNFHAEYFRRNDADDRNPPVIFLTKPMKQTDGSIRNVTIELTPNEVRILARQTVEVTAKPARTPTPKPNARPEAGGGAAPTPSPKPRRKPGPEAPPDVTPDRARTPARPIAASAAERPAEPGASPFVIGVWHGVGPPKKGQWVKFPMGQEDPHKCPMAPINGEARTPEEGAVTRYVVARRVLERRGVGEVVGSTKNLTLIIERTKTLAWKEEGAERFRERMPPQFRHEVQRPRGIGHSHM